MRKLTLILLPFLAALVISCSSGETPAGDATPPPLTEAEQESYRQRGREIAQTTFAELSGRLSRAMAEGGVENALRYCNVAAYPLVDSLSRVHQATIRRTTLRPRNPQNAPSEGERAVLTAFQQEADAGGEPVARVERLDEQTVAFYAPIRIQPLCLQCHGRVGEELRQEDYELIRELYPADQATGYQLGDLRGMWNVRFGSRTEPENRLTD